MTVMRLWQHGRITTSPLLSTPDTAATAPPSTKVSLNRLTWLYVVIPLSVAVVLVDQLLLGQRLRDAMPSSPRSYLLFALIFGTPHIVASNLIMFTTPEYFRHYRQRLLKVSALLLLFFATFGLLLPRDMVFAAIAAWTVIHVVKQQIGIGNISSRLSGRLYAWWTWTGITAGVLYYVGIFRSQAWFPFSDSTLRLAIGLAAGAAAGMTLLLLSQTSTPLGRRWLLANGATMVVGSVMFLTGYPLLAILIPRLVHDGTAFAFYLAHDANRLREGTPGLLYRRIGNRPIAAALTLPAAAIGLSALLERGADDWFNSMTDALLGVTVAKPMSLGVVGFLALLHYSFESVTWKEGSPYRRFVHLS